MSYVETINVSVRKISEFLFVRNVSLEMLNMFLEFGICLVFGIYLCTVIIPALALRASVWGDI